MSVLKLAPVMVLATAPVLAEAMDRMTLRKNRFDTTVRHNLSYFVLQSSTDLNYWKHNLDNSTKAHQKESTWIHSQTTSIFLQCRLLRINTAQAVSSEATQ